MLQVLPDRRCVRKHRVRPGRHGQVAHHARPRTQARGRPAAVQKLDRLCHQGQAHAARAPRGARACSDRVACWLSPIAQTLKQEGPFAFYRGWLPSYLRLGPHFIMVRRPALLCACAGACSSTHSLILCAPCFSPCPCWSSSANSLACPRCNISMRRCMKKHSFSLYEVGLQDDMARP